jgi:hypothetical protein
MALGIVGGCSQSNAHPPVENDCQDDPALKPYCVPAQLTPTQSGGDGGSDAPVTFPDTSTLPDTSSQVDAPAG